MATIKLKTGLFNTNSYDNPDRRYSSFDFVKSNSFNHNGFVSGERSEFSVVNQSGLTLDINQGIYNIQGHYIDNDTNKTFQLQPTTAGFERYDIITVGVTRDANRVIDGTTFSREGFVRVIQGEQAEIGTAQPSFGEMISEEFLESSGTKEVELAIIKVVSGAITEIVDRRVSTNTEEISTVETKFISVDNKIDMSSHYLESVADVAADGSYTGSVIELENKHIELRIDNPEIEGGLISAYININDVLVELEVVSFNQYFNKGDNVFKFVIKSNDVDSKLYLLHLYPDEFIGGLLLEAEFAQEEPSFINSSDPLKVVNTYLNSNSASISEITDNYIEFEFNDNLKESNYDINLIMTVAADEYVDANSQTRNGFTTWKIQKTNESGVFEEVWDGILVGGNGFASGFASGTNLPVNLELKKGDKLRIVNKKTSTFPTEIWLNLGMGLGKIIITERI